MISRRLQKIVDRITYFDTVSDIGSDHGFVGVELIRNNKAKKVIATDISYPSFQKTVDFVNKINLQDKIETRVGNGLEVLNVDESDAVIIAGMGGVLISDIIKRGYDDKFVNKTPVFILQPVQQSKDLRYYLYENQFEIEDETIVKDMGKYYDIIVAKKVENTSEKFKSITKYKDIYMEYGIINITEKNVLLREILQKRIEHNKKLLSQLKQRQVKKEDIDIVSQKIQEMEAIYETL